MSQKSTAAKLTSAALRGIRVSNSSNDVSLDSNSTQLNSTLIGHSGHSGFVPHSISKTQSQQSGVGSKIQTRKNNASSNQSKKTSSYPSTRKISITKLNSVLQPTTYKSGNSSGSISKTSTVSSESDFNYNLKEIYWKLPDQETTFRIHGNVKEHMKVAGEAFLKSDIFPIDLILRLGETIFEVHSTVVIAHSPLLFHRLNVLGDINGEKPTKLDLSDLIAAKVTPEGLKATIDFMYNGKVSINIDNMKIYLAAANILAISEMVRIICEQMALIAVKQPKNAFIILETVVHNLPRRSEFRKSVINDIALRFSNIRNNPEFFDLSMEALYELFSSNTFYLHIGEALKCLILWIKVNPHRRHFTSNLLDTIEFNKLTNEDRAECLLLSESIDGLKALLQSRMANAKWTDLLQREHLLFITSSLTNIKNIHQ